MLYHHHLTRTCTSNPMMIIITQHIAFQRQHQHQHQDILATQLLLLQLPPLLLLCRMIMAIVIIIMIFLLLLLLLGRGGPCRCRTHQENGSDAAARCIIIDTTKRIEDNIRQWKTSRECLGANTYCTYLLGTHWQPHYLSTYLPVPTTWYLTSTLGSSRSMRVVLAKRSSRFVRLDV